MNANRLKLILYIIIVCIWLYARQWPFGDTLQTATDVMLIAAGALGYFNYMKKKYDKYNKRGR